jgi:hypothetical protein
MRRHSASIATGLHRMRRDVDDAIQLVRGHSIQRRLDQGDRRQHVAIKGLDLVVALDLAKIARRRPPGVVDENVWFSQF